MRRPSLPPISIRGKLTLSALTPLLLVLLLVSIAVFYLINAWGPTRASLVTYVFPIIGLVLGIAASLIGVLGAIGPGFATDILHLSETDFFFIMGPAGLGAVTGILFLNSYGRGVPRRLFIDIGLIAFLRRPENAAVAVVQTPYAAFPGASRAVERIESNPGRYAHYLARETGGLLKPEELQSWRLLHAAPQPYTRERWEDTYNWTVKWGMTVPGATYENTVDNRAWQ